MRISLIINLILFFTLLAVLVFWGVCELIWKIEYYLFQRDIEKHEKWMNEQEIRWPKRKPSE